MSIKNLPEHKTVSIYDPSVQAYREVSIDDYKVQLKSLGLTDEEVAQKVDVALKPQMEKLSTMGLSEAQINKILK
jgi:hypothetical protein